jgi:hypothetical protein
MTRLALTHNKYRSRGLRNKLSNCFYDIFTRAITEAVRWVLLLEESLLFWSLAIDEHGHENLRGSGHRSVIPYVHMRTELYYSIMSCLCEPEPYLSFRPTHVKWRIPEPFITQGRTVIMSPDAR